MGELGRAREALVRGCGEAARDGPIEGLGNVLSFGSNTRRGRAELADVVDPTVLVAEGQLTGEQLVEDRREGVNVAAPVQLLTGDELLGTHVRRSAGADRADGGELLAAREADRSRDSEVGDQCMATGEDDV